MDKMSFNEINFNKVNFNKTSFSEMLKKYADNYESQIKMRETLLSHIDKMKWQEAYMRRADELGRFFEENEKIIDDISHMMEEPLDEEVAEFVYQEISQLFQRRCFDACLMSPILARLIAFYENTGNTERLIRMYEAAFQTLSLSAAKEGYMPLDCYQYAEKIFDMRDKYAEIKDPRGRLVFFEIYNCICGVETGFEYCGVEKAYRYFKDMYKLWESETVQKLDGERREFQWYVELVKALWVTNTGNYIDEASDIIKDEFVRLAEEQYAQECEQYDGLYEYDYNIYENHLRVMIMRGEISCDEAIDRVYDYYKERIARLGRGTEDGKEIEGGDAAESDTEAADGGVTDDDDDIVNIGNLSYEDMLFLLDAPRTITKWTKQCGRDRLPDEMLDKIIDITQTVIYKNLTNTPGQENEINDALAVYCFALLPFLRNREEKENWLFNLIVRRQLPTYIHCSMVQHIAGAIFEDMYRDRPELFADVVRLMPPEELPDFVTKCAIFHDVGKNKIAGIINIQTRAIRDNEFNAIHEHPKHGFQAIYSDYDFSRYKDVALGHHKFYNGKGGYPEDFDNTASPYRSVIDLITICDCMDAATDRLGRNYKKAKTVDEVFGEFERDKGIRYNPDMVDYIYGSESLKRKLRHLVTKERLDIAYEIYRDFIK